MQARLTGALSEHADPKHGDPIKHRNDNNYGRDRDSLPRDISVWQLWLGRLRSECSPDLRSGESAASFGEFLSLPFFKLFASGIVPESINFHPPYGSVRI